MNNDAQSKILIIDDNPANLRALLLYLEQAGFDILIATSGERALQQLECLRPDLILLDVLMPDINGFETCRQLKANAVTKEIPVIFMTALTDTMNKIKGFEVGAIDYVTKPFQHEEVLARVHTHLTIRRLQQQRQTQNLLLEEKNQQLQREITERKRAEETLRQYNRELSLLQDMGDVLQTCRTEQETYSVVINTCKHIFPSDSGCLCLRDASQTRLKNAGSWGEQPPTPRLFIGGHAEIPAHGKLHTIENPGTGTLYLHLERSSNKSYSHALRNVSGEISGVLLLCIQHEDCNFFNDDDTPGIESKQMILSRVAEHYALVLGNLRLRERLKMESIHDPLTGLYNRRHMEAFLKREIHRSERHRTHVGFIMLDIDHFKHVNDTHGHDTGDAVLKELGGLLQNSIRGGDIACRYGGEEFLLILPEVSLNIAAGRAEELRKRIQELRIHHNDKVLQITISLGVATLPEHGFDTNDVIKAADEALYQAKAEGRNRVARASSSDDQAKS